MLQNHEKNVRSGEETLKELEYKRGCLDRGTQRRKRSISG
jgi:hypothetical protein